MSEFMFIIPQGWTEVSSEILGEIGSIMGDLVNANNFPQITEILQGYGVVPLDMNVYDARLFNGEVLVIRMA
jgi:hypothetical protein